MTSSDGIYERVLSRVRDPAQLIEEDPTVVVETTQGDERVNPTEPARVEAPKFKTSGVALDNLFRNPDTHPLTLDLALLSKYGADWMGWELETLVLRVQQDFKTPTVSEVNLEKVQACKALHLVDTFWLRWEIFLHCCAAFNGAFADFHSAQVPEVAECMVAVDVANRIRDDMQWSTEVKVYLQQVYRYRGELFPTPPMEFVEVDTSEFPVDAGYVRSKWPLVKASGRSPRGATIEDEQLRRMFASWVYLEANRQRLESQLQVLRHV
jgi:hypothetical protein